MQRDFGVSSVDDHCYSWLHLSISSLNHNAKFFLDGYATPYQLDGTLLYCKLLWRAYIVSVMFKAPVRPSFKSSRVLLISPSKPFILSHSCKQTTMNGAFSLILKLISIMLNPSGVLVLKSVIKFMIVSSFEPPPPPPAPAVIERMVSKRV